MRQSCEVQPVALNRRAPPAGGRTGPFMVRKAVGRGVEGRSINDRRRLRRGCAGHRSARRAGGVDRNDSTRAIELADGGERIADAVADLDVARAKSAAALHGERCLGNAAVIRVFAGGKVLIQHVNAP